MYDMKCYTTIPLKETILPNKLFWMKKKMKIYFKAFINNLFLTIYLGVISRAHIECSALEFEILFP